MWTRFWDMHSGGGLKEKWAYIYIEAPEDEAKVIFYNRFGHNPQRVTCTCCGEDYAIDESFTLEQASGYHRGCAHSDGKYIEEPNEYGRVKNEFTPFDEWFANPPEDVLILEADDIRDEERLGTVPDQGYVWVD